MIESPLDCCRPPPSPMCRRSQHREAIRLLRRDQALNSPCPIPSHPYNVANSTFFPLLLASGSSLHAPSFSGEMREPEQSFRRNAGRRMDFDHSPASSEVLWRLSRRIQRRGRCQHPSLRFGGIGSKATALWDQIKGVARIGAMPPPRNLNQLCRRRND